MASRNFDDFIRRDLEREIAHHERLHSKQQPPQKPPAPQPTIHFLDQVPDKPLTWLWPGRIPSGHLTLLDAASGSGLSLVALSLAACVSSGSPLPDGTPTQQGHVLLLAPYDSPTDLLKPRLEAAGADPTHLLLVCPLVTDASRTFARTRSYAFPQDLDHLASLIHSHDIRLLIIDPASAIPGLTRCLPALVDIARQTNCAIVLTRSLHQSPLDPFHAPAPTSPLLQAARSRLLLAPDPAGDGHQLLLTTKHPLCTQPPTLAYDISATEAGIPTIHWLGERDHDQLMRLSTGPLRSPHRQAILRFLQHSANPKSIPEILEATCYDDDAGRKMLERMKKAKELVSPARGLYTTAHHPCLLQFTQQASPVSNVTNVSSVSTSQSSPPANSLQNDVPSVLNVLNVPTSQSSPPANSLQNDVTNVTNVLSPQSSTLANSLQNDITNVLNVLNVSTSQSSPPANSPQSEIPPAPAVPVTDQTTSTLSLAPNVPNVPNISSVPNVPSAPSSQSPTPANSPRSDTLPAPIVPVTDRTTSTPSPVPNVSNGACDS